MGGIRGTGGRPTLPPGRTVDLPGRGTTFVRELAGPDGAPTLVLLHGWTATADLNWHPAFEPLADQFHIVAMDHRGHGRGLRAPFRLGACADDVAALLEVLGIERAIVVGYSMGGAIAQLLARRRPDLVDGLVLCATSATFNLGVRDRMLSGLASGGRLLAGAVPVQPLGAVALRVGRGWGALRGGAWWGYDEVAGHDWTQIIEAGRRILRFDSRPWIGSMAVPTAVIATDHDDLVPHRRQLQLAAAIPGATVRILDGGHTACTQRPEEFVPMLVDACTEVAERVAAGRGAAAVVAA